MPLPTLFFQLDNWANDAIMFLVGAVFVGIILATIAIEVLALQELVYLTASRGMALLKRLKRQRLELDFHF